MFTYVASGGLGSGGSATWGATPWRYTGSGSLSTRKCGASVVFTALPQCYYRFLPGDYAWLAYKASQGVLEYVVVKKIRLNTSLVYQGNGPCVAMYIDTFNRLYNEWDLVTESEANALVAAYEYQLRLKQEKAGCLK